MNESWQGDLLNQNENRYERLQRLMNESFEILSNALDTYVGDRTVVATCALYSGGNDSTAMTHMFKDYCDYAVHINTGIGIEQTRNFVKETCDSWGLPVIVKSPPAGSASFRCSVGMVRPLPVSITSS